jgi:hypothetical protein
VLSKTLVSKRLEYIMVKRFKHVCYVLWLKIGFIMGVAVKTIAYSMARWKVKWQKLLVLAWLDPHILI